MFGRHFFEAIWVSIVLLKVTLTQGQENLAIKPPTLQITQPNPPLLLQLTFFFLLLKPVNTHQTFRFYQSHFLYEQQSSRFNCQICTNCITFTASLCVSTNTEHWLHRFIAGRLDCII